ncbi:LysM peptidoglycan-binding domain-containing protein [Vagococcus intermedius]|uniref:LysM peptidoglycan-binding domain-containing protein n=1 Tax=Vagococcus intermedius TaxID=2991418 RepID=A0AAF0CVB3_9ENTE|nr:LysM peptidoglycan-binding domain-containing protein [Vagococcus intermedius]WEG73638.1 LysM peptidoglycan-binding domain-containing protein [Vagococcus intermedius]WEG75722.1 LysM peptidoglycan-binding domain-containing protein [Vagococcus intermedius]
MSVKKMMMSTAILGSVLASGLVAMNASADSIYTVKGGDSLSEISYRLNGDSGLVAELAEMNNIKNVDLIFVGQKLNLSIDGTVKPATTEDIKNNPEVDSPEEALVDKDAQIETALKEAPEEVKEEIKEEIKDKAPKTNSNTPWSTQTTSTGHFTYYDATPAQGWGNGDFTADGTSTRTNGGRDENGYLIVAADPSIYSMGQKIETPWGTGVVHDTGGAIKGSGRFDVLRPTN